MKDILARANQRLLADFSRSNVLLAFDYDGTLARIVDRPGKASMRPSTRRYMRRLALLYPCVVISGRARSDIVKRMRGLGLHAVIGNHGAESRRSTSSERLRNDIRGWLTLLEPLVSGLSGVWIEDKGYSLSIHLRGSRTKRAARRAILEVLSTLGHVRSIGGKQVINVVPLGAPDKGAALQRERDRLVCDTAIYVGDDETDEDVFALDLPGRLVGIRVGRSRLSNAEYYLRDQPTIDLLVLRLIQLRAS